MEPLVFLIVLAIMMVVPILIARVAGKLAAHVEERIDVRSPHLPTTLPRRTWDEHPQSLELLRPRPISLEVTKPKLVAHEVMAPPAPAITRSMRARGAGSRESTRARRALVGRPLDVRRGIVLASLLGPPRGLDWEQD